MTRRVLIVTHGGRPQAVAALAEALRELKAAGFEYTLHDDALAEEFGDHMAAKRVAEGVHNAEAVMVLGGDGTILRAAELTRGTSDSSRSPSGRTCAPPSSGSWPTTTTWRSAPRSTSRCTCPARRSRWSGGR